jgi:5-formyltetrahydrofolate cyclo-ligase
VDGTLRFVSITALSDCVPAKFGLREPLRSDAAPQPDVQVIPMLAFNERKFRLGYGKGYYDAYLKTFSGVKLGLCYAEDAEVHLVEDPWDIPLDEIVSER